MNGKTSVRGVGGAAVAPDAGSVAAPERGVFILICLIILNWELHH